MMNTGDFRRRQWHSTPVLLPGKSHGWRSMVGCIPWGRQESDTTERLHFDFSLSCIGEGNGNPLQYSCLENPRDGGAWWAAVYGVAQSWTRLKWLSFSTGTSLGRTFAELLTYISLKNLKSICPYEWSRREKHKWAPFLRSSSTTEYPFDTVHASDFLVLNSLKIW